MAALARITPERTAAILLAAGAGRRFGSDKLSARLGDATVLERSAAALRKAGCFCCAGVIAENRETHAKILTDNGFTPLVNREAASGISSSIRLGVQWAKDQNANAALIALADMPFIPPEHFSALFDAADSADGVSFTCCEGQRMPPAVFDRKRFDQLLSLSGDVGAKGLLREAPQTAGVEADRVTVADIDRRSDLERARS